MTHMVGNKFDSWGHAGEGGGLTNQSFTDLEQAQEAQGSGAEASMAKGIVAGTESGLRSATSDEL